MPDMRVRGRNENMVAPLSFPPGYRAYVGAFLSLAIFDLYMVGLGQVQMSKM